MFPIQAGIAGPVLEDASQDMYVFRITDAEGDRPAASLDEVSCPPGWVWEDDEWEVDRTHADCDEVDGWSYAVDFVQLRRLLLEKVDELLRRALAGVDEDARRPCADEVGVGALESVRPRVAAEDARDEAAGDGDGGQRR